MILDVMMPGLSGFDVAAMLKNDPDTQAIPILILTIVSDEQRGLRLGVDRYMHKPMDGDALAGAVHDLLAAGGSRRRVLVVDEDKPASSDVARLLETKGYQVVGTVKGEEALAEARHQILEGSPSRHHLEGGSRAARSRSVAFPNRAWLG